MKVHWLKWEGRSQSPQNAQPSLPIEGQFISWTFLLHGLSLIDWGLALWVTTLVLGMFQSPPPRVFSIHWPLFFFPFIQLELNTLWTECRLSMHLGLEDLVMVNELLQLSLSNLLDFKWHLYDWLSDPDRNLGKGWLYTDQYQDPSNWPTVH